MLKDCAALLVARSDHDLKMLHRIAGQLEFGCVERVASHHTLDHPEHPFPLQFFFVHSHFDEPMLRILLQTIRASTRTAVRFAPVITFIEDVPFEDYLAYIELGFDDVVVLPENRELLAQRLQGQIGATQTYFETSSYLGPDRRRMELPGHTDPRRAQQPIDHRTYQFQRHVESGITVLRREVHLASNHMPHHTHPPQTATPSTGGRPAANPVTRSPVSDR